MQCQNMDVSKRKWREASLVWNVVDGWNCTFIFNRAYRFWKVIRRSQKDSTRWTWCILLFHGMLGGETFGNVHERKAARCLGSVHWKIIGTLNQWVLFCFLLKTIICKSMNHHVKKSLNKRTWLIIPFNDAQSCVVVSIASFTNSCRNRWTMLSIIIDTYNHSTPPPTSLVVDKRRWIEVVSEAQTIDRYTHC